MVAFQGGNVAHINTCKIVLRYDIDEKEQLWLHGLDLECPVTGMCNIELENAMHAPCQQSRTASCASCFSQQTRKRCKCM